MPHPIDTAILADTPFAYWTFEEASSPVLDQTANNNDLTVTGGTFGATGPFGDCVEFDGVNDYATVDLDLSATQALSIEWWFRWDAYSNDQAMLAQFAPTWSANAGGLAVTPNAENFNEQGGTGDTDAVGKIMVGLRGPGFPDRWTFARADLTAATFHQFVITINRANGAVHGYVDGAEITKTTISAGSTAIAWGDHTLDLMARLGDSFISDVYSAGALARVAVFDAILSGAQITAHYDAGPSASTVAGHYSGGADNDSGPASLGGEEGAALGDVLFGTPTNTDRLAGVTDYRCIYLHAPVDVTDLTVWVDTATTETDVTEAIGEDPSNPAQTVATAKTAPSGVTFSAPASEGAGLALGAVDAGEAVPLWIRRAIDAAAASGDREFVLGVSWVDADTGAQSTTITVTYPIVVPVTLYVDADHDDASDAWTRVQAADDPDSPFASMQAAAMLLQPGDTMQVEPSTLGNANTFDPYDTDVYAGITHRRQQDLSDTLPYGENSGNEPILVTGHIVGDVRPRCRTLAFFELENWQFEGFQRGYDSASTNDFDTVDLLHNCTDLVFTDVVYTGGGNYCVAGNGVMEWVDCVTYAPWTGGGSFLAGSGFHLINLDTSTGLRHEVTFRFTGCHFEDIGGEDAIQASLGTVANNAKLEVFDCTFANIQQVADPSAPHTDCIQFLGGHSCTIIGSRWEDCDSVFIASDGETGRLTFIDNLVTGAGNGFHGQGCAQWIVAHNTVRSSGNSVSIGNRLNLTQPLFEQNLVVVNNIIDSFNVDSGSVIADASVVEPNTVISNPGAVTPWGTHLSGLPEFGPSTRLTDAGIDGDFELANSPVDSPGIGDGRAVTGLGLTSDELTYAAADLFGRAFASPRDVGCLQSDPGTPVTPAPRAPYVVNRNPDSGETGVARNADVTFDLVPVPGQEVNPATVTTSTVYVADATAFIHLPTTVTMGALEDGAHAVTVDLLATASPPTEGDLFPLVLYVVTLDGVADTEGSELPETSWSFRVAGTGGPAIGGAVALDEFADDAPQTYSISGRKGDRLIVTHTEMRFPAGTELTVWEVTADREITGSAVATGVVSADFSVAFGGLEVDRHYVTGPSLSGPFSLFRVYG